MAAECAADQLLGGRYALVEVLGHGASGVVWRARDQLLHRDVAVKEIRFPLVVGAAEDALREAVLREARAAARLNHPGAVTVFDVVEEGGRPLIVMELIDAPTLAELVEADGPLPAEDVAAIGVDLLDALDAGHPAGIVHRDVKPRNVMVGRSGRVRLADFGVAAVIDDVRRTTGNAVIGSPAYMAPEQVNGDEVGRAADLWALGATLYFAVEGRPPYDKGTAIATMTAIVLEPPRPTERAGALAPLLDALLAKDPAARPNGPFLRMWLANLAGESATGRPNPDATSQFSTDGAVSGVEVTGVEVTGVEGTGVALPPGQVSPGGPDVVVIPRPSTPEVPLPGPTGPGPAPSPDPGIEPIAPPTTEPLPTTLPTPMPEPTPTTEPVPIPEPPPVPPAQPVPVTVPGQPEPEPDPMHVPSEPDPLVDPTGSGAVSEPTAADGALLASTAYRRTEAPGRVGGADRRRGVVPLLVAVGAVLVVVIVAAGLLVGRDDDNDQAGSAADGPTGSSSSSSSASSSAGVPADWVPYADPATGFTVSHPPGWTVAVDGSLTDISDPETGAYLRIDHVEPPGPSPEGAWYDFEPRFAAENAGYRRIRIEPTTYAGFPAAIWEFTYGADGASLRAIDLGFVTGRYGFALNFQTREADWVRLQPVFEAFKTSFRAPAP